MYLAYKFYRTFQTNSQRKKNKETRSSTNLNRTKALMTKETSKKERISKKKYIPNCDMKIEKIISFKGIN